MVMTRTQAKYQDQRSVGWKVRMKRTDGHERSHYLSAHAFSSWYRACVSWNNLLRSPQCAYINLPFLSDRKRQAFLSHSIVWRLEWRRPSSCIHCCPDICLPGTCPPPVAIRVWGHVRVRAVYAPVYRPIGRYRRSKPITEINDTLKHDTSYAVYSFPFANGALFCSVLQPSSIRGLATPWTYFLHLSLSSVILTDSSTWSPVHVLMLSIKAVRGLPRLRAPGIVPCLISFSRQLPCFLTAHCLRKRN